ncbi:uncharacterized protein LY79DRAFT_528984 [Colletotrichum navitas]|uniref:Integral membrane protein n=1 Tax=Colletotrichum navitas TaxID=681940 RepID=A0AAD8PKR4_9PEZI|nr:uncharacterized protein LY79DRAFT_528984 [Colletotrichum navitas]KAK1566337.1 hypothetical protein LY79DRAFT_528984 [Colletotrichum navitas]
MPTSASGQNDNKGHKPPSPFRQIRAWFDEESITVYQAYNLSIATAAVKAQRLDASPGFKVTRMTWIKPSWAWMLYRAGYSFKDPGQERILALKMRHGDFIGLLRKGVIARRGNENRDGREIKIQWDPERDVRLERLQHRSIQIGIPPDICRDWVATMIVGIEDVTARARKLKRVLEERPGVDDGELIDLGLLPAEKEFEVPKDVEELLEMNPSERLYD